ncbi:phospholipid carrier-dependent glycosyltransferase [Microbispora bryophytorum]|uniref:phospholipid carrier-dependent glycosyltransferase n=1 Tax=Microbispora bryophytorum TaxID=1460882 RepID=UPI0033CF7687
MRVSDSRGSAPWPEGDGHPHARPAPARPGEPPFPRPPAPPTGGQLVSGRLVSGRLGRWLRERVEPRDPLHPVAWARAGLPGWARRHRWFLVVFGLGALLRLVTALGYRPALWFPDSYTYVVTAMRPRPDLVRPAGYSMFLRLLEAFHSFALVVTVQHMLGLLVGVMVYVTVRRRGGPSWAAVLACVPVLLDAYQIELEHLLVSDSLFTFLVVGAVCLAMRPPTPRSAAALGLVLAAATLTRTVGLPLIAVFALVLLAHGVRGAGAPARPGRAVARLTVPFLVAALLPVAGYAGWFYTTYQRVGLVGSNGVFLYARTMAFADCSVMKPPADLAVLCDSRPPASRPASQEYIWNAEAPLPRLPGITFTKETDTLAGRFASLAIRSQPLDYLRSMLTELGRSFTLGRPVYPDAETYRYYEFPDTVPPPPGRNPAVVGKEFAQRYEGGPVTLRISEPFAGLMRAYQDVARLPGTALLVILLAPPAAWLVRAGSARTRRPPARRAHSNRASSNRASSNRAFSDWGIAWATAWALLLVPPATAQFDYRYVLPVVPLACLAAALSVRRLRRRTGPAAPIDRPSNIK